MAVPKRKTSKAKHKIRRNSNTKIVSSSYVEDKKSGDFTRPHHIRPDGSYNNRQILHKKS